MSTKQKFALCILLFWVFGFSQNNYTYVASSNSFDATAFNNSHKIASPDFAIPGDSIHVVYHSLGSVLYTFTTDHGMTWTIPAFLGIGNYPGIDVDLYGFRHIVWQSLDTVAGDYEIYYDCLDDFSPPINVSESPNNSILPDIVVDTSVTAHIVWVEDIAGYNQIYYRTCQAGALSDTLRLSDVGTAEAVHSFPSISIFQPNHRVYALWDCNDPGSSSPYQVHSRYLEDSTWSQAQVWASYQPMRHSSLDFCHGEDSISACWEDSTSGNLEAFFLGGNPGGGYATSGLSTYPVVSTVGPIWSYLFWSEDSSGFEDICCHWYYFMGGWSQETIRSLFNIDEQVRHPSCCGSFVIWTQGENPPYDIYFSDFGYPVGSAEITRITPRSRLSIWPNPFRQTTTIKFQDPTLNQVQGKSQIAMSIYDAAGRLVKDFSRFTLDALRPTLFSWDGTNNKGNKLPAGTYFCVMEMDQGSIVEKVVKVD